MKKVLIKSGSLILGGPANVLIRLLKGLDRSRFSITVLIENDFGEKNIYEKDVPSDVKYIFLNTKEENDHMTSIRSKKNNIFYKIYYNYLLVKNRKNSLDRTKKLLKDIGGADVYLDMVGTSTKYINELNIKKTIVRISNSISAVLGKRQDKIIRFGKRLDRYSNVLVLCDDMKKEVDDLYPYLADKTVRIYNPLDMAKIRSKMSDTSELTQSDEELMEQPYFVSVCRLNEYQKDITTLIKAYKKIHDAGIKDKLYILGDGPDRKKLMDLASKYGLDGYVYFLGTRKNPYIWLKNAKLYVHSSKNEGMPNSLIEAMACGKMVISSDCPTGPREILDNERCGVLFPIGDSEKLAALLTKYLSDEHLRNEKERFLPNRIKEFDSNTIIKEYEKLFDGEIDKNEKDSYK